MPDLDYPLPAFSFKVQFLDLDTAVAGLASFPWLGQQDTSFQEVSGIETEMQVEDLQEGGENRFVHQLPKGAKQGRLSLKRGVMAVRSPLLWWCKQTLERGMDSLINPATILVLLLDENHMPIRVWKFVNAYPVRWELEPLDSMKNEVAVERIDLVYQLCQTVA